MFCVTKKHYWYSGPHHPVIWLIWPQVVAQHFGAFYFYNGSGVLDDYTKITPFTIFGQNISPYLFFFSSVFNMNWIEILITLFMIE